MIEPTTFKKFEYNHKDSYSDISENYKWFTRYEIPYTNDGNIYNVNPTKTDTYYSSKIKRTINKVVASKFFNELKDSYPNFGKKKYLFRNIDSTLKFTLGSKYIYFPKVECIEKIFINTDDYL